MLAQNVARRNLMNKPLPTYEQQEEANADVFQQVLKDVRPDLYAIMLALDETKVNWTIPWKVIEHLRVIAETTKYGKVIVEIENNTVRFVRGEAATKMNEPLTLDGVTPVGVGAANNKFDKEELR